MALDFIYKKPKCGETDDRPSFLKDFHFMYFALMLFLLTSLVCVVVSLLTKPVDPEMVIRTTFWTRFDQTVRSDEVKERIKVRNVDAKEEAKRHENEVASSTASTMWIKDHDEIQFQNTGNLQQNIPKWKKALMFLCGVSDSEQNTKVEREEQTEHMLEVTSLHQTRREKQILYFNLIVVCLLAIFLFVFYSVPDGGPTAPTIKYGSMIGGNSTQ